MSIRIKELRKEKNLTLLQIANRLGLSESTVQRYESGNIKNLKYETIVALAEILSCSPCYLMGWDDQRPQELIPLDEYRLLGNYRKLNSFGREKAQEDIEDLTQIPKYTDDHLLLNAAHQRTDIEIPEGVDTSDDEFFD